jgi:hypothetical protein
MKYISNLTRSNAPGPYRDLIETSACPAVDHRNQRFFMNMAHCPAGSKKVLKPESGIPIPFV